MGEFEELLRRDCEALLQRFVAGVEFPDVANELPALAASCGPLTDSDRLKLMAKLFDRPAFYTPVHQESNLGDFRQAITDTIQAIGTGINKTRDGTEIGRIPSRHQLVDQTLQDKLQTVEKVLAKLRTTFDSLVESGDLKHCACNVPGCPTYFMSSHAANELELKRNEVFKAFRNAYPAFIEPVSL